MGGDGAMNTYTVNCAQCNYSLQAWYLIVKLKAQACYNIHIQETLDILYHLGNDSTYINFS